EESAEAGSPGIIVYGYDGLPMQPIAPPSSDYVPRPEHPSSPDYAPLEDQYLPANASPTAASPSYVADSDPDENPEEDPEDDHADYPADGGDGDDEPSDDDDDDDDTDDEDEEPFEDEEEEHLAPADSSVVPIVDHVLPSGDTEVLEADEPTPTPRSPHIIIPLSQTRLCRARKTVRLESSMSASIEACIARHDALLSPPLPVPSPPLPLSSPLTTSPTDTGAPLGYKAAGIRMRALLLSTSRRTDIPEADVPPRKRACLTTPASGFEVGKSFAGGAARKPGPTESDLRRCRVEQTGYGITNTWDEIVDTLIEIAPTTLEGVNQRVTELDTTVRQRTDEFEVRFEKEQDDRALLRARVNTLFRDRPDHRHTAMFFDREAMYAREAWAGSEDRSVAIASHVRTLKAQDASLIAQTSSLQTQLTTTLGCIEILEARNPEPQEGLAEAGSSYYRNGDNNNDSGTGGRRKMTTPRECTYTNFLKYQPMSFQGTEGVVGLTRCDCPKLKNGNQGNRAGNGNVVAKAYAVGTAGTNPNSNVVTERDADRSRNGDNSNDLGTGERRKMTTPRECTYTNFLKYQSMSFQGTEGVVGLTRWLEKMESIFQISNCTIVCQEEIEFATEMMDKKMLTHAERQTEHKRKFDDTSRNNQHQQQPFKRNNMILQETTNPLCSKWALCTKSDCPKLKNGNQGNRAGNGNVVAKAYAVGTAGTNPNSNVVTEMGSFDVIIGMDWLVKYHVVIVCDENLVRVPLDNKILIFHGDGSNNGHESRLNIISCTKTQRYLLKGCPIFLAHVTTKGAEDKSKEKRLKDVPIVQDFPEVFLEDLLGIPPTCQVEFQIDLIPGAAPVARAPY
nr:reverse transcriptase domain-containing protein [Tanacetum cinerariifolium]